MQARVDSVQRCDSFLHLHLGIDATGLPSVPSEAFPAQWAVVKDWEIGVDAPRNLVRASRSRSRATACVRGRNHMCMHMCMCMCMCMHMCVLKAATVPT